MFTRGIGNGEERSIDCSPVAAWARTRVGMIRGQRTVYPKLYQLYHALGKRLSKKTRGSSSVTIPMPVYSTVSRRRRLHANIVNSSGTGKSRMVDNVAKNPALCVGATRNGTHWSAHTGSRSDSHALVDIPFSSFLFFFLSRVLITASCSTTKQPSSMQHKTIYAFQLRSFPPSLSPSLYISLLFQLSSRSLEQMPTDTTLPP